MNHWATTRRVSRLLLNPLSLSLLICVLAFVPASGQKKQRGAAAKRNSSQTPKAVAYYSCPMHGSVKAKSPGKCPKCGMALRAVHVEDATAEAGAPPTGASAPTSNAAPVEAAGEKASNLKIPDLTVLDQEGRKIHFYTDLIKGKTVVINFIFTTCTTICPPLGATFARVQKELGERTGREVHFISISVDPVTDTPERLKAWGAKFKAGAGWTFVTGDKPSIDSLLGALGASTAQREDHSPTVLIGNDSRGIWTRAYGLSKPSQILQLVNDAVEGKNAQTPKETSKQ